MVCIVYNGKSKEILYAIIRLCGNSKLHNVYIRRWGSRNTLKGSKIVSMIKDTDFNTYIRLMVILGCSDDSCLSKSITQFIIRNFKSLHGEVYKLGDICNAIQNTVILEYE